MKAYTQPRVRLPVVQQVVYAAHDVPGGSEEVCHCEQLSGFSRASYPKLRIYKLCKKRYDLLRAGTRPRPETGEGGGREGEVGGWQTDCPGPLFREQLSGFSRASYPQARTSSSQHTWGWGCGERDQFTHAPNPPFRPKIRGTAFSPQWFSSAHKGHWTKNSSLSLGL